jgi:hypothetical protein
VKRLISVIGPEPTGVSLVKVTGSATSFQICSGTIGMATMVVATSELGWMRLKRTVRSSTFSTDSISFETELKSSAGNFFR